MLIKLKNKKVITLYPIAPYNFDGTIHKPSHFPSSDNLWEKDNYWITMLWRGQHLGLKFQNRGSVDRPKIKVVIYSKDDLPENYIKDLVKELEWRFNTKSDISEFNKKFREDKYLCPILVRWRGVKPVAANSLYETLVIYIVLQNATVRHSVQMLENLFNKYGQKAEFDGKTFSTFWGPEDLNSVAEQELRDLKLGYRAKFLKRLSSQFANQEINEFQMRSMSKKEIRKEIIKLYGIGPASVEYLLFEDFYKYDALDTIPPWEQKIMSKLLFNKPLVPVEKILQFFRKRYTGWEKLAFHYIWEDLFWKHKKQPIEWLKKEIRL